MGNSARRKSGRRSLRRRKEERDPAPASYPIILPIIPPAEEVVDRSAEDPGGVVAVTDWIVTVVVDWKSELGATVVDDIVLDTIVIDETVLNRIESKELAADAA